MSKIAFVFSGQGSQYIGMGRELYDKFDCARKIYKDSSGALEFDIEKMIFDGDEDTLRITENTQPAIVTTSIACLEVAKEKGINPDFVAGLSLGEYSAHVSSGSIGFEDAVKLVRKRGRFMQQAVPEGVGTMAAIIGLENKHVIRICDEVSQYGIVEPANFNCPGQVVISGEIKAVDKAIELAESMNAKRAIKLPVSAPFHCSMLKGAGEKLKEELDKININDMSIPVITNVTGDIIESKLEIKQLLVGQVSKPVLWERSINTMIEKGVDTFIELGPGKVLSGFIKKINRKLKVMNVQDMKSLNKTLTILDA